MRFAAAFVSFHLLVLATGAVLIFVGGAPRDLGMALVVGALFGFGAFIAQVWTMQVSREQWLSEDEIRGRLADLNARWDRALEGTSPEEHQ